MRRTPHASHSPRTDDSGALGPEHPLVRASEEVTVAIDRCVAVASMLAAGIFAVIGGLAFGPPLVVASASVLAVLLVKLGASTTARDRRALELIAAGRGDLPQRTVVRLQRRLLDPAQRERLARSLDMLRAEAARPVAQCHSIRPIYDPRVVRALSAELADVAQLIRDDGALRGLARVERLVSDGLSPLYGSSEATLRQELRQIRFLLSTSRAGVRSGEPSSPSPR